jgi:hypothetical protein
VTDFSFIDRDFRPRVPREDEEFTDPGELADATQEPKEKLPDEPITVVPFIKEGSSFKEGGFADFRPVMGEDEAPNPKGRNSSAAASAESPPLEQTPTTPKAPGFKLLPMKSASVEKEDTQLSQSENSPPTS